MRLHSDFQDYYDNAVGFGIDENVHYNRYKKSVSIGLKSYLNRPLHRNSGLIGFCGKTYPFIELNRYDRNYNEEDGIGEYKVVETAYAFDLDEYIRLEQEWSDFSEDFYPYLGSPDIRIKQFYVDWVINSDEIITRHKVPVWMAKFYAHEPNGVLNPRLKDFAFNQIKESIDTFQEISMYLSNILVEQRDLVLIGDEHRIEQHGFDSKLSFRKTKKK
jgi:hypothetical protein